MCLNTSAGRIEIFAVRSFVHPCFIGCQLESSRATWMKHRGTLWLNCSTKSISLNSELLATNSDRPTVRRLTAGHMSLSSFRRLASLIWLQYAICRCKITGGDQTGGRNKRGHAEYMGEIHGKCIQKILQKVM